MDLRGLQRTHGQYYSAATSVYLKLLCSTACALTRMTHVQDSPPSMAVDLTTLPRSLSLASKISKERQRFLPSVPCSFLSHHLPLSDAKATHCSVVQHSIFFPVFWVVGFFCSPQDSLMKGGPHERKLKRLK